MFINKVLKELTLVQQSYFKTSLMSPKENGAAKASMADILDDDISEQERHEREMLANRFENKTLEKLTLGLGLMCTIKPLL